MRNVLLASVGVEKIIQRSFALENKKSTRTRAKAKDNCKGKGKRAKGREKKGNGKRAREKELGKNEKRAREKGQKAKAKGKR